jgi:hypothetical protein
VTEERSRSTGQDCRQADAVSGDAWVPDCVCTAIHPVKPSTATRPPDAGRRVCERQELLVGHHAVLFLRKCRELPVRSYFLPHIGNKCDLKEESPLLGLGGTSVRVSRMPLSGCFRANRHLRGP